LDIYILSIPSKTHKKLVSGIPADKRARSFPTAEDRWSPEAPPTKAWIFVPCI